jgi:hypothetical protein
MGIERQKMKDEDFAKMILGMMEAREKERMLGIRVLIIAHNAYKFQGCAQIYRNYLPQHIAIHVRKQYLEEKRKKRQYRIYTLRDMGYDPYVMVYDKPNAPREIRRLQRWCNSPMIFRSCPKFENYK